MIDEEHRSLKPLNARARLESDISTICARLVCAQSESQIGFPPFGDWTSRLGAFIGERRFQKYEFFA